MINIFLQDVTIHVFEVLAVNAVLNTSVAYLNCKFFRIKLVYCMRYYVSTAASSEIMVFYVVAHVEW
jgi:hypothetical protein